jgi:hypothetical protein
MMMIDEFSTSTADSVPAMFQDAGRGPLFGWRSNGAGGNNTTFSSGGYSEAFEGMTLALLQNIARHSKTGLMKAEWDKGELAQMKDHRYLGFTNADVDLIYTGKAARQAAGGARTVANRVE